MGSKMKPTVFNERVAKALKHWHQTAKRNAKDSKHSSSVTPLSSRPATPERSTSPIHLLQNFQHRSLDSLPVTEKGSHVETEHWAVTVGSHSPPQHGHDEGDESLWNRNDDIKVLDGQGPHPMPGAVEIQGSGSQHAIDISLSDFTFRR